MRAFFVIVFALTLTLPFLHCEESMTLDKIKTDIVSLETAIGKQTKQLSDAEDLVEKHVKISTYNPPLIQAQKAVEELKRCLGINRSRLSTLQSKLDTECKIQVDVLIAGGSYESYRTACMWAHSNVGRDATLKLVRTLGTKLESQDQYANAASLYKQFSVLDDSLLALYTRATQKSASVTMAQQCEEAGDYTKALNLYQTLALSTDVKRVAEKQARRLEKNGKYAQAVGAYETAGLLGEARRLRENNIVDETISAANSSDVYESIAPAVVTVICDKSFGSGFFVKAGGYIVTNNHVIYGTDIKVRAADKKEYTAILIYKSETPDIAIIKIVNDTHPVVLLGDSDTVKAGQTVSAIGTPYDETLAGTFTQGVISATDRKIFGNVVFQVDAAINKGNSGGPLLDEHGKVIGVNTFGLGVAKQSSQGTIGSGVEGINFAIKINEVKPLLGAHIPNSL